MSTLASVYKNVREQFCCTCFLDYSIKYSTLAHLKVDLNWQVFPTDILRHVMSVEDVSLEFMTFQDSNISRRCAT